MMRLYQKATSDINKINRDNSLIIIMQETSFCSTFYFKMSHKRVASGGKFRDLNFLQVDICCWWLVSRPEPVKAGMVRRINLLLLTWTEWFFGRSSCQTTVSRRAEPSRAEPSRRATRIIVSVRECKVDKVLWFLHRVCRSDELLQCWAVISLLFS